MEKKSPTVDKGYKKIKAGTLSWFWKLEDQIKYVSNLKQVVKATSFHHFAFQLTLKKNYRFCKYRSSKDKTKEGWPMNDLILHKITDKNLYQKYLNQRNR